MTTSRISTSVTRSELPVAAEFTADYLHYNSILPLRLGDGVLEVATCGTPAPEVVDDLERCYDATVALITVDPDSFAAAIHRAFAGEESIVELVRDLGDSDSAAMLVNEDEVDIRDLANQPPVVRFVNLLIREAHSAGASDIHLESTRDGLRVRFRIDGVLRDIPAPPRALEAAVISRVKLLAQMDIADRRVPQDGRIRVRLDERELDLRVATVPTLSGESVVLRLLDRGGKQVPLDSLGMPAGICVLTISLSSAPGTTSVC